MALDTRSKRMSAVNVSCPWRGSLPIPDGTISQGDRQHFGFYCAAVLFTSPDVDTFDPTVKESWLAESGGRTWNSESDGRTWNAESQGVTWSEA